MSTQIYYNLYKYFHDSCVQMKVTFLISEMNDEVVMNQDCTQFGVLVLLWS